jgi:hypothetical protein
VARFTNWLTHLWAAACAVVTTSVATIWHVLGFIRERRTALQQQIDSLRDEWKARLVQLQDSLEQRRKSLAEREADLSAAVGALAERTKEFDLRVQERQAAEQRLTQANSELEQLSSTRLLDEFLKSRLATDSYQKQLGFLALVRRDFERLSDLIARANVEWCDPSRTTDPPPLNRIVLYIDDLDRCSEETVLKDM